MTDRRLRIRIVSPVKVGFEGEGESVVAPAYDGKLGILYGHAPMTVLLGSGELVVRSGGEAHRFYVARGFLQVVDDEVSVLAEEVEVLEAGARGRETEPAGS